MQFDKISTERCQLGECPIWCDDRKVLWWVDVLQGSLWSFDPASGDCRPHKIRSRRLGSIALFKDAGLLLACDDGLYRYNPDTGDQDFLVDPDPRGSDFRKNDGRVDPYGNFWVGTLREKDYAPVGRLFRVTAATENHLEVEGMSIPNGLAFDFDRRRMYLADTRDYRIWVYDQSDDGTIANRREFAATQPPARPDGSCVDNEGRLWNAVYAGARLACYAPSGQLLDEFRLPISYPTCCCFGGPKFDQVYVTSASHPLSAKELEAEPLAGHVLVTDIGAIGRPENRIGWMP